MTTRMKGARMNPSDRKNQILEAAIQISLEKGYRQLTRRAVASRMQCASSLINHYFVNIEELRSCVLQTAKERELLPILAENFARKGPETLKLDPRLQERVVYYLTN